MLCCPLCDWDTILAAKDKSCSSDLLYKLYSMCHALLTSDFKVFAGASRMSVDANAMSVCGAGGHIGHSGSTVDGAEYCYAMYI